MKIPNKYDLNCSGRLGQLYFKKNYPEFLQYLLDTYTNTTTEKLAEKLYLYYNGMVEPPKCPICGKYRPFLDFLSRGYQEYCSGKCSNSSKDVQKKKEDTCLKNHGVKHACQNKYIKDKLINTYTKNHGGMGNASKSVKEKQENTMVERYGCRCFSQNKELLEKSKSTWIKNHNGIGVTSPEIREKFNQTMSKLYGDSDWISGPNKEFFNKLKDLSINLEIEYPIQNRSYDFKIDNILIEVNPFVTHNSTWCPFGEPKSIDYHFNKTKLAIDNKFRIINIWDWDDTDKIINSLTNKETIYARNCVIKDVSKKETKEFLNTYHFQNNCNGQKIRIGLYYNDELIEIMTFGKPRYNKKFEWELLRLCSKFDYKVIGGSEKLFKYFINNYNPQSIISYCDNSKFKGDVYERLGFNLKNYGKPTKHWYNPKTTIHITDNLLRQRGFDQLFKTNYGKGTSNEELMLIHEFVEIYDAGQSVWVWNN